MAKDELESIVVEVDDNGKLIIDEKIREPFRWLFLRHAGKKIVLSVKRWRDRRSLKQNSYYHAVVVRMIGEAMGEDDMESVHQALKAECNYEIRVGKDNQEMRFPLSTARLDTNQMFEYIERCRRFAARFYGLDIPDPTRSIWDGGGI